MSKGVMIWVHSIDEPDGMTDCAFPQSAWYISSPGT